MATTKHFAYGSNLDIRTLIKGAEHWGLPKEYISSLRKVGLKGAWFDMLTMSGMKAR